MKTLLVSIALIITISTLQAQQRDSIMLADGRIMACVLAETSSGFEEAPLDNVDSLSSLSYPFDFIVAKLESGKVLVYKPDQIKGFFSATSIGTSHLEPVKGRWYLGIKIPVSGMAQMLAKKEIGKHKFACVLEDGKYITLYYTKIRMDSDGSNGAWAYGTQRGNERLYELISNVNMRVLIPKCPDMIYAKKYNKKGQSFYQFLMDVAKDYNIDKCN